VYARGLAVRQAQSRPVAVHARLEDRGRRLGDVMHFLDHGAEVRLVVNNFTQRNPLSRNSLHNAVMERDVERLLEEAAPDLVHVHHLAGHSLALPRRLAARSVPYVLQLQDWWLPCARTMLLRADRSLCSGPGVGKCARCLPLTGLAPAGLWSRLLHRRRRRLAREVVRRAAALVAGSRFAADSVTGFLGTQNRVQVLPYGVEMAGERAPRPRGAPLRFGVLGAVMPHKGAHVAVAAFRGIDPARAVLEVWGDPAAMPAYARELREAASPAVTLCGAFPEAAKAERLSALDVLIVPSLGLESFSIAAREAMARGVPVLASRRGALAEAFVEGEGGAFFEAGDAAALRGWIDKLCADPGIVNEWSSRLPAVKTMDAHAEEIDAVYETVLAGGRRR
jgi:glycosyltransferase involved in cell wall biosynthesis